MTPTPAFQPAQSPRTRAARILQAAALALLLGVLVVRPFLAELPYRTSLLKPALSAMAAGNAQALLDSDRTELARVGFGAAILLAGAMWAAGGALAGRLQVRCAGLGLVVLLLAGASLLSTLGASDRRSAWEVWLEQNTLMLAGFLAVQLLGERRRWGLLVALLAALGATLAAKGLWQYFVEAPDRIADFDAHKLKQLAEAGLTPFSPQALAFEGRLRDRSPTGFGGLANLLAAMLLVLGAAAVGLTIGRVRLARTSPAPAATPRKSREIPLPALAGVVLAAMTLTVLAALSLTGSRGALLAGLIVTPPAVAAILWREPLARRWKTCALTALGLLALGLLAVTAYGLRYDRLPTKTMTFRWHYWTGAAQVIADSPWRGVGGGNFASAYLRHRRYGAEEEVKMPHNFLLHAAAQFGLPGGLLYVAGVLGITLAAGRRGADPLQPTDESAWPGGAWCAGVIAGLSLAVLIARVWATASDNPYLLTLEAVAPAAMLGGALLISLWTGPSLGIDRASWAYPLRVCVVAGLAAFVIHNLVEYGLWAPGAAMVFWVTAGACAAQGRGGWSLDLRHAAWPVATLLLAAGVAAWGLLGVPVKARLDFTDQAIAQLRAGNPAAALHLTQQAAQADPLDAQAAQDAARLAMTFRPPPHRPDAAKFYDTAYRWSAEAFRRDSANPATARLAAQVALDYAAAGLPDAPTRQKAADLLGRAVQLDPAEARLRIQYAALLCDMGQFPQCRFQLTEALAIDAALIRPSQEELTPAERQTIARLQAQAREPLGP